MAGLVAIHSLSGTARRDLVGEARFSVWAVAQPQPGDDCRFRQIKIVDHFLAFSSLILIDFVQLDLRPITVLADVDLLLNQVDFPVVYSLPGCLGLVSRPRGADSAHDGGAFALNNSCVEKLLVQLRGLLRFTLKGQIVPVGQILRVDRIVEQGPGDAFVKLLDAESALGRDVKSIFIDCTHVAYFTHGADVAKRG